MLEPATPDELTHLYELLFGFASEMLAKRGTFLPFGGHISLSQGPAMVAGLVEEHNDQRGLYQYLLSGFRASAHAGEVRAIGLAADVNVPPDYQPAYPEAVRVLLETPGYARFVYSPYRLTRPSLIGRLFGRPNDVTFAESFSVEIPSEVFAPPK